MYTLRIFKLFFLTIFLLLINSISFGMSVPICNPPDCKIYTVTNPTDGEKLSVNDWGASKTSAPAILFIHGFPHDQFFWSEQISSPLFKGAFRVITMDWRGFGLSNKPVDPSSYSESLLADDINAVLNALNINKVVIVAHSAGGIPLESYIKFYGTSRLNGIVITDAIVDNVVLASIPPAIFDLIGQSAFAPTPDDFTAANQQFLTLSTYAPLDPGMYNFLLTQALIMPQAARQALLGSLGSDNLTSLQNTNVKKLIIWGEMDQLILVSAAHSLNSMLPNNKLVIFPNVGHSPMLENPVAYNLLLTAFVRDAQK